MTTAPKRRELSRLVGSSGGHDVHADALNYSVSFGGRTIGHLRTLPAALRVIVQHAVRRSVECADLTAVAADVQRIVSEALVTCQRIADGTAKGSGPCEACDGQGWNLCPCGVDACTDRLGCESCGGTGMVP